MILESLKLENIRSYLNEEINFPESSVLLAGDIGSGKSTILLAIEFALFGIKSDLPGESLLRHGKNNGSVELKFSIGDNNIIIKRNLKRMKESVRQDSGHIMVNDRKIEGTATELKTRIINILGYPESIISKSKDLIYRFTVYTPQEDMKQILYENKDIRLDTLRKVFGIDKYKTIRENVQNYIRELKTKTREFEASISDLEEKKDKKNEKEKNKKEIGSKIENLVPDLEKIKKELKKQKKIISDFEKDMQELNRLNSSLEVCDNNIINNSEQSKSIENEIGDLTGSIEQIKKEISKVTELVPENIEKKLKNKQDELNDKRKKLDEINEGITKLNLLKQKSEELKQKISKLDVCPLCKQKVNKEHINDIISGEDRKLKNINEKLSIYKKHQKASDEIIDNLEKEIEGLNKKERNSELNKLKIQNIKEKSERISKLKNKQNELKQKISELKEKREDIKKKIEKFKDVETKYNKEKQVLEKILDEQKDIEIKISELKKEKDMLNNEIKDIDEEINKKLEIKKKIIRISQLQQWLDKYLSNLMQVMEKQIMGKVYSEFNELVVEWFNTLMDDEVLNIRLDDEFTPVIEQNGYETFMGNLSGGEKTAVALSYRLALNKVINDLISGIKTKDIIILDEPTDGFSTEQLDRVREVIDSLKMKQIIIVSHEQKIETFVENIIRITKTEHVSHVF
jgi:DNA repair protein SbcC/Rad50